MSFPKINFEERRPSTFWQDISKDIFSPFAPANKTLLVHLANLSKKASNSQTPLKIHPLTEKKQPKNIPRKLINNIYHEILTKKKKKSISLQIEETPLEFNKFGSIRRRSCHGSLFGLDTPFQKKTNNLAFRKKTIQILRKPSTASSRSSGFMKRNSISISALVKTSDI